MKPSLLFDVRKAQNRWSLFECYGFFRPAWQSSALKTMGCSGCCEGICHNAMFKPQRYPKKEQNHPKLKEKNIPKTKRSIDQNLFFLGLPLAFGPSCSRSPRKGSCKSASALKTQTSRSNTKKLCRKFLTFPCNAEDMSLLTKKLA